MENLNPVGLTFTSPAFPWDVLLLFFTYLWISIILYVVVRT